MRRIEQPFTPLKNSFSEETVIFSFENLSFYEEYVLRTYQCTYNEDVILICLEKPTEFIALTQPLIYFKKTDIVQFRIVLIITTMLLIQGF